MIYLYLFVSFLQVGMFSFGGGYAAMPLIQGQVVTTHHWLSMEEFTDLITISQKADPDQMKLEKDLESMSRKELEKLAQKLTKQMKKAAAELDFETAAQVRDQLMEVRKMLNDF